ncbi:MAG: hypothetical protein FJW35_11165 [Acidobacteria bacterium]|nr:hypothetical protein [Acidobacteriota bacterium]
MNGRKRKVLNFAFLALLLLVAAFINYFHADGDVAGTPYCPACTFQSSAVAVAQIDRLLLPDLTPAEILHITASSAYDSPALVKAAARSPPPGRA